MNPILLTPADISIAASLIILDAALSIWLKIRLHRQIAVAAARMVVQLVAIGYVLRFIFSLNNPAATLLLILIMVLVAAREVAARPERRFKGQSNLIIGFVSVGFATFVTAILALTTAIRPQPWFDPHYAIPLAGIILGNVLNSASLSLDSFLGSDIHGATLGVIGMGRIGQALARRARGFNMQVIYHNRSRVAPERWRSCGRCAAWRAIHGARAIRTASTSRPSSTWTRAASSCSAKTGSIALRASTFPPARRWRCW